MEQQQAGRGASCECCDAYSCKRAKELPRDRFTVPSCAPVLMHAGVATLLRGCCMRCKRAVLLPYCCRTGPASCAVRWMPCSRCWRRRGRRCRTWRTWRWVGNRRCGLWSKKVVGCQVQLGGWRAVPCCAGDEGMWARGLQPSATQSTRLKPRLSVDLGGDAQAARSRRCRT